MTQKQSKEMRVWLIRPWKTRRRVISVSLIFRKFPFWPIIFLIASGSNKNQVQAMVDNVQEELHKARLRPKQVEGYNSANWILLDYGDTSSMCR